MPRIFCALIVGNSKHGFGIEVAFSDHRRILMMKYEEQLNNERQAQRTAGRTEDFKEGVTAFNEKRDAKFTGN